MASEWSYDGPIIEDPVTFERYLEVKYPDFDPTTFDDLDLQCEFCLHQLEKEGSQAALRSCENTTHSRKVIKAYKSKVLHNLLRNDKDPELFGKSEDEIEAIVENKALEFIVENSPVHWAQHELNKEPYWYQKFLLDCTSKRKAVMMGRRAGKSFTLSVLALWVAATRAYDTRKDGRHSVMIIAHSISSVNGLWGEINGLIDASTTLKHQIKKRLESAPKKLVFNNGSEITLYVGQGDGVRGQTSNAIFIDEADYCSPTILPAIKPIVLSNKNTLLWYSSTPTGEKTDFYRYVTDKSQGYKSYIVPSYVSEVWSGQLDLEFRTEFTKTQYEHEILAEFGDPEMGVYRREYVHEALSLRQYSYRDCEVANYDRNYRVMGVDWNPTKGVQLLVLEWVQEENDDGYLKTIHKDTIAPDKYTMHAGVERVLKVMQSWGVNHVYVDRGAGEMAIEHMLIKGEQNPALRIKDKLVAVDFSKKVEVLQPGSYEVDKKHTKPLLVKLSTQFLERGKVAFPEEEAPGKSDGNADDITKDTLCDQMLQFRIEKYSASGIPKYVDENDHLIVCWICAIFGFVQQRTNLLDYRRKSKSQIIMQPSPAQRSFDTPARKEFAKSMQTKTADIVANITAQEKPDVMYTSGPDTGYARVALPNPSRRTNLGSGSRSNIGGSGRGNI